MNVSGLIRVVSLLLTAIVAISFGMFVWDDLGSASKNQAALATASGQQIPLTRDLHGRLNSDENGKLRVNLDKINDTLTSPGESLGKKFGASNPWAMRAAAFFFGLLIFLIGLRFLANWVEMSGPTSPKITPHNPQGGFTAGSR